MCKITHPFLRKMYTSIKGGQSFSYCHVNSSPFANRMIHCLKVLRSPLLVSLLLLCHFQSVAFFKQEGRFSYHAKNTTILEIFRELRRQTGTYVMYYTPLFNDQERVSMVFDNATVEQVLQKILSGKNIQWIFRNDIVLLSSTNTEAKDIKTLPSPPGSDVKTIRGKVIDETGNGLPGATITVTLQHPTTSQATVTNDKGQFQLENVPTDASLAITYVGYAPQTIPLKGRSEISVKLQPLIGELNTVSVVSTGFQKIPKERATGSFDLIDNKLLNRTISTDIMSRLEGVASGLLFNRNKGNGNEPAISIRGRSTIFANTEPLIILDNFPYSGDINNINPNDIESITILKDAAAASIWGIRSGNGVIVITTKRGKANQSPKFSFNANTTIVSKPDLFYQPQISSSDFVDVEKYLYGKGKYDPYLEYYPYTPQSPVVDILYKQKRGLLSASEAKAQLDILRKQDVRNDLEKYFYRTGINQQYNFSLTGGTDNQQYFLSAGYDRNLSNSIYDNYNRFTLMANSAHQFLDKRLELNIGILLTNSTKKDNANTYVPKNPYERVLDAQGSPLAITGKDQYRNEVIDTFGNGKLLDWHYYPYKERYSNNKLDLTDYKIDASLSYKIFDGLSVAVIYQYSKGTTSYEADYDESSYFARNIINRFTAIDPTTGEITRVVPMGNVFDKANTTYKKNDGRLQLSYQKNWQEKHEVNAIAGFGVTDLSQFNNWYRLYGYDPSTASSTPVDFIEYYPTAIDNSAFQIPNNAGQRGAVDRSKAYYFNASYTYDNRYILSVSGRRDESNLFGVKANQKGTPFWTTGVSWNIGREPFYNFAQLPNLKLRLTYGYNGQVDKSTYAYTTAVIEASNLNIFGLPIAVITNPPNPSLGWEKIRIINAALEFGARNNIINGSIEYYRKSGIDLLGYVPLAPQSGMSQYKGNVANTETKGVDITINTKNINKEFKWNTVLQFSYVQDIVTNNKVRLPSNGQYASANYSNPLEGRPYSAVFSFKWAGLDPETGDPQGYSDKGPTKDYGAIINSTNTNELVYHGSGMPTHFGNLMNTFSYKNFEFSINILYKGGYYFRRPSLEYSALFNGGYSGQGDYSERWQKSGDEQNTNVPSMSYPENPLRDQFYKYSEALVEKGDHIRLKDIRLGYSLNNRNGKRYPFSNLQIYTYINNIGILWRANNKGIDPDAGLGFPAQLSFSVGVKADF